MDALAGLRGKAWYRPNFGRSHAEQFLQSSPVGTFVIRPSSTADCLALSQKNANNEIFHARINCCKGAAGTCVGFSIGTDAEVFPTVEALLQRVQPQTPLAPPQQQHSNNGPGDFRQAQSMGGGGRGVYPPANNNNWQGGGGGGPGGGPGGYRHPSMGAPNGMPAGMQRTASSMPGQSLRGGRGGPMMRGGRGGGAPGSPMSPRTGPGGGGGGAAQRSQSMRGGGGGGGGGAAPTNGFAPDSVLQYSTQIELSELIMDKEIGSGSFGTVYKGHWRRWQVAIKQLKTGTVADVESKEYKEFVAEAELMTRIQPHPNVVRFVGVTRPPNLCIVLEFVDRGALYDYLQGPEPISGETMLNFLKGTCNGMAHLHREKVIHRDLAARNVLLDRNLSPKLGDFGMSRMCEREKNQTKSDTGPLKWMSPESIKNREYSTKSDIWAFAVTVTEILTRCSEPYPDLEPIQVATRVAYEDLRPPIPPSVSPTILYMMQVCSERKPEARPEFTDVLGWLSQERTVWAV